MRQDKLTKLVLLPAGAVGAVIGSALLLVPDAFHAWSGIDHGGQVSLLNEIRAPGGALLACGLLVMAGGLWSRMTFTSLVVSATLYLSYGLSRLLSLVVDGWPTPELVVAMVAEIVIGAGCLALLMRRPGLETGAASRSQAAPM